MNRKCLFLAVETETSADRTVPDIVDQPVGWWQLTRRFLAAARSMSRASEKRPRTVLQRSQVVPKLNATRPELSGQAANCLHCQGRICGLLRYARRASQIYRRFRSQA